MKKLITTLTLLMVAVFAFGQSEYRKMYGKYEYYNNTKFLDSFYLPNLPGVGNNVVLDTNTGMLVIDSASTVKTFESGQNLDLITSANLVKYLLNDTIDSLSGVITDSLRVNRDAVYFNNLSGTGDNLKIDTATGKVYRGVSGSPLTFSAGSNITLNQVGSNVDYSLNSTVNIADNLSVGNSVSFPNIPSLQTSNILYVDGSGEVSVGAAPSSSGNFYRTYVNSNPVVIDQSVFNTDIISLFTQNELNNPVTFNENKTYTADATINVLVGDSVDFIPAHDCAIKAYISVFSDVESENTTPSGAYTNLPNSQIIQSIRPEYDLVDGTELLVKTPRPFHETMSLRSSKFRITGNPYIGVIVNVKGCGGADFEIDTVLRIRRTSSYNPENENAFDSP